MPVVFRKNGKKRTQILRKKAKNVAEENLIWLFSSLFGFTTMTKIEPNNEEKANDVSKDNLILLFSSLFGFFFCFVFNPTGCHLGTQAFLVVTVLALWSSGI